MVRRLLRQIVPVAASLIFTAGSFFAIAGWRRSGDAKWCRDATVVNTQPGGTQTVAPELVERERAACAIQRQRQRAVFGAIWRTGGQETAECGFTWARFQIRTIDDPEAAAAILGPYGIDDTDLEPSSREDQQRFINACLSNGRQEAR